MRRLLGHSAIRRFVATVGRYSRRHGPQHAAAITYFSVLTLIPVLMLAGAAAGFTLTVLRPDWFHLLSDGIVNVLGGADLAREAIWILRRAIENWYGLAGTALVAAAYSGSNWVGNLRVGFCVMLQTGEEETEPRRARGFLKELAGNLLVFLGLFACLLLSSGIAAMGIAWANSAGVVGWLFHLLLNLLVSWLLFAFLFCTLPRRGLHPRHWLMPSLGGALLVALLQQFAGVLIGFLTSNPAAVVPGPVIVIMILFNLMAMILLLCSAWAGERIAAARARVEAEAREMVEQPVQEPSDPEPLVPVDVAAQGVRAGMRIGYGMGAVTGFGLGAAVTALFTRSRRD